MVNVVETLDKSIVVGPDCAVETLDYTRVAFYISRFGNPSVTQNVLTYEQYLCCLQ